jgi:hypothetical protein
MRSAFLPHIENLRAAPIELRAARGFERLARLRLGGITYRKLQPSTLAFMERELRLEYDDAPEEVRENWTNEDLALLYLMNACALVDLHTLETQ